MERYGNTKGKNKKDLFFRNDPREIERCIIDFIIRMKEEKNKSYSAIHNYVSAITSFYRINDVILNTKKINDIVMDSPKTIGIDVGWDSSAFGLVLLQVANGRIEVLIADEYERPRYEDMIDRVTNLIRGLNSRNLDQSSLDAVKIYVDAANPEFITTLKELVGESTRWDYINEKILYYKKHNLDLANYMTVIPVPFNTSGKDMLMHTKELLEYEKPLIAINPKFDKLITSLRTCTSDDKGSLIKEDTSYDNVLDAFRLALKGINLVRKETQQTDKS